MEVELEPGLSLSSLVRDFSPVKSRKKKENDVSKGKSPIVVDLKQEPKEYNFLDNISLESFATPVGTPPSCQNFNVQPNLGAPVDTHYKFSAIPDILRCNLIHRSKVGVEKGVYGLLPVYCCKILQPIEVQKTANVPGPLPAGSSSPTLNRRLAISPSLNLYVRISNQRAPSLTQVFTGDPCSAAAEAHYIHHRRIPLPSRPEQIPCLCELSDFSRIFGSCDHTEILSDLLLEVTCSQQTISVGVVGVTDGGDKGLGGGGGSIMEWWLRFQR
ncbi:hypothetical protein KSP39_PZI002846 [Platanthera zijinensis]|uniref:Uncharacterized protein n=1 Tax=Platanthera zijinensis TaxID=2320716 RepID=A0AAP0BYJ7_9ASPA